MKKHSCGAILYTIYKNDIYIILGMEKGQWFPFKGTKEKGETNEMTAMREIQEETCDTVYVRSISLDCNYSSKRKHYHIGLIQVSSLIINEFYRNRDNLLSEYRSYDKYYPYLEKTGMRMFSLTHIFKNNFHDITISPISYYYPYLRLLQKKLKKHPLGLDVKSKHLDTNALDFQKNFTSVTI
jgi:hypothetical protein